MESISRPNARSAANGSNVLDPNLWRGRILLINPPHRLTEHEYYLAPPLGLLLVSSVLKQMGCGPVALRDMVLELACGNLPKNDLCRHAAISLSTEKADIYAFSVQCFNLPIAIEIARLLHALKPDARIHFGGPHTSLSGQVLTQRFPFIDQVDAGPVADLTVAPDYGLLADPVVYHRHSRNAIGLVEVIRGCPYRCTFCIVPALGSSKPSYKSPSAVLDEVEALLAMDYSIISFVGDTFTLNVRYVSRLLQEIHRRKLCFSWTAMTRTDCVDWDLLTAMGQAGCRSILYGAESDDQTTLNSIHKKTSRRPDLARLLIENQKVGINPTFYFLVNLPHDTMEGLNTTLTTVGRLSILDPGCCRLQLPRFYPGAPLTRDVCDGLELSFETPYSNCLNLTLGSDGERLRSWMLSQADLFSSYAVGPGPVDRNMALVMANHASNLFEWLSMTMGILTGQGKGIDFFRQITTADTMRAISPERVLMHAMHAVMALEPALEEAVLFEIWIWKHHYTSDREEVSATMPSRVAPTQLRAAAAAGEALDISKIYGDYYLHRI